jgi:hypothetical protein
LLFERARELLFDREALLKESDHRSFLRAQLAQIAFKLGFGAAFQSINQGPVHIGTNDVRMDVAFPADGHGIAETLRDRFDGLHKVLFGLRLGVESLEFPQRHRRENGAGPGPKIFGGKILPRDLAQIIIHIPGLHVLVLAFFIAVLEQFLAGQVLAAPDNFREAPIANIHGVRFAGFAAEMKR